MILFILSVFLPALFFLIAWRVDRKGDGEIFYYIAVILLIGTLASVLCFLLNPIEVRSHLAEFDAARATLEAARIDSNLSSLEVAAIQQKVLEENKWLARVQFWTRHPLTNWFYPKFVLDIEPIK